MNIAKNRFLWSVWLLVQGSCSPARPSEDMGQVTLALDGDQGDLALAHAHVSLSGPSAAEADLDDGDDLSLSLEPGVYQVTIADDYRIVKRDAPDDALAANLVGENPTSVLVAAGETTRITLHFELEAPPNPALAEGAVAIDVAIDANEGASSCARHLRISELDYDQPGSDTREFVEVAAARECSASLEGVTLELVNGGDGSVYAHYDLASAAATLAAGQVLVVGDADVLAQLPARVASMLLNGAGLQNGPDALRLVRGMEVLDSVAYEGAITGLGHGQPALADDAELSLTRCSEAGDDAADFVLLAPSPGVFEACPAPSATPPNKGK